ncbi:hypothetical protein FLK61_24785 [Paenalkalicoccus suaedae]|uniref:Uncharacterized protein n=1 Tax=Paenalkalicoccus suaedae TaxID=2592382 RepID=A0A859FBT1_9BACI|nr:hypothetical protein [Paenalkalicoccus suaedae]QKS69994.1 hypothetical protein FLK61_24785 [Paenalkalicoccus suaedae]
MMRVFWNECKKMMSWPIILLIVLVNVAFYVLFIEFYFEYFPNGSEAITFELESEWIQEFGPHPIAGKMIDDLWIQLEEEKLALTPDLFTLPQVQAMGVDNIDDIVALSGGSKEYWDMYNAINQSDLADDYQRITQLNYRLHVYEESTEYPLRSEHPSYTEAQQQRYAELENRYEYGTYQTRIVDNIQRISYFSGVSMLTTLSLLLAPAVLRDTNRNTTSLLYTSKVGRRLAWTKWRTGLLLSFLFITLFISFLGYMYVNQGLQLTWGMDVAHFGYDPKWIDMTVQQYILLSVGLLYAMGMLYAVLALALSHIQSGVIAQLSIQTILVSLFIWGISSRIVEYPFSLYRNPWTMPVLIATLVTLAIATFTWTYLREQKKDL